MQNRINILNRPIDKITMEKTLEIIDKSIEKKTNLHHIVVNAAKMLHTQKDKDLYDSMVNRDIINADGQAVVWASKFSNQLLYEC